jgi:hypothetical protein
MSEEDIIDDDFDEPEDFDDEAGPLDAQMPDSDEHRHSV